MFTQECSSRVIAANSQFRNDLRGDSRSKLEVYKLNQTNIFEPHIKDSRTTAWAQKGWNKKRKQATKKHLNNTKKQLEEACFYSRCKFRCDISKAFLSQSGSLKNYNWKYLQLEAAKVHLSVDQECLKADDIHSIDKKQSVSQPV